MTSRAEAPPTPLRLLLVEDDEDDAWLIIRTLRRRGYVVTWQRVDTMAGLAAALERAWDLVTCDWNLPGLETEAALALIAERCPGLAVVAVSSDRREEVAARVLRAGARHFVAKEQLKLLAPVVDALLCAAARTHRPGRGSAIRDDRR